MHINTKIITLRMAREDNADTFQRYNPPGFPLAPWAALPKAALRPTMK